MDDWEKAIAHWLPDVWYEGKVCDAGASFQYDGFDKTDEIWICSECGAIKNGSQVRTEGGVPHKVPRPPPSRDLGFRLLDAMKIESYFSQEHNEWVVEGFCDSDLLTAITKAAAALADKEQP